MKQVLVLTHPESGVVGVFSSMDSLHRWTEHNVCSGTQEDAISNLLDNDFEVEWIKLDSLD